jgi:hypothetical protein
MRHASAGLLWHAWRLSRRWYLLILAVAVAIHFTIMNLAPAGMADLPDLREHLAPGSIVLALILALFSTLVAISLGGRAGFPMRFEFRLPQSTALLVGMPMLLLGTLCASLYAIPLLASRLLYGLPMPVMAGTALIATVSVLLAAASWATTTNTTRGIALILAVTTSTKLMTSLQPFHFRNGTRAGEPVFGPDVIFLSPVQYALLALLIIALYGLTVRSVALQRQGERWRITRARRLTGTPVAGRSSSSLVDRASDLLRIPSPVSSPQAAELWVECKRLGIPLLAMSVLLALLMPVLPWTDSVLNANGAPLLATAAPVVLFFTGVGLGIFNRRTAAGGYMNPFEGTRAIGTLQMAGIQLGSLGTALLLGTGIIGASMWLSSPLYVDQGPLWSRVAGLIGAMRGGTLAQQAGAASSLTAGFFAVMAFLFCVHSCSTFWGRKVMYGALAFLIYAVLFAHAALTSERAGEFVAGNMWGLAAATLVLTLLLLSGVTRLRLFTLKAGAITLLAWLAGVAGAVMMLERLDVRVLNLPLELQVLNAALMTLPLTLLLCTVWCYDRLRHR